MAGRRGKRAHPGGRAFNARAGGLTAAASAGSPPSRAARGPRRRDRPPSGSGSPSICRSSEVSAISMPTIAPSMVSMKSAGASLDRPRRRASRFVALGESADERAQPRVVVDRAQPCRAPAPSCSSRSARPCRARPCSDTRPATRSLARPGRRPANRRRRARSPERVGASDVGAQHAGRAVVVAVEHERHRVGVDAAVAVAG